jgi:hypothetical protein
MSPSAEREVRKLPSHRFMPQQSADMTRPAFAAAALKAGMGRFRPCHPPTFGGYDDGSSGDV